MKESIVTHDVMVPMYDVMGARSDARDAARKSIAALPTAIDAPQDARAASRTTSVVLPTWSVGLVTSCVVLATWGGALATWCGALAMSSAALPAWTATVSTWRGALRTWTSAAPRGSNGVWRQTSVPTARRVVPSPWTDALATTSAVLWRPGGARTARGATVERECGAPRTCAGAPTTGSVALAISWDASTGWAASTVGVRAATTNSSPVSHAHSPCAARPPPSRPARQPALGRRDGRARRTGLLHSASLIHIRRREFMMQNQQRHFDALRRTQSFLDSHAGEVAVLKTCDGRVQLDDAVVQIASLSNEQGTATRQMEGLLSRQKTLISDLRYRHMQPIATFARARLGGSPDFAALTRSTLRLRPKALVHAARTMATAAAPHADALTRGGFPDGIIKLVAAADALTTALEDRANTKVSRVRATKGLTQEFLRGREALKMLHAVVNNQFAGDPTFMTAWHAARRAGLKVGAVHGVRATPAPVGTPGVPVPVSVPPAGVPIVPVHVPVLPVTTPVVLVGGTHVVPLGATVIAGAAVTTAAQGVAAGA